MIRFNDVYYNCGWNFIFLCIYKYILQNKDDWMSESIKNIISTAVRDRVKTILTHISRI